MKYLTIIATLLATIDCSELNCNCVLSVEEETYNRCIGVICDRDSQCQSGLCFDNFCTIKNDDTGEIINCSNDDRAECGKCPGKSCDKPVDESSFYKFQCQYHCATEDGIRYACSDCTCDRDHFKKNLC